jgi:hypothetical protein
MDVPWRKEILVHERSSSRGMKRKNRYAIRVRRPIQEEKLL